MSRLLLFLCFFVLACGGEYEVRVIVQPPELRDTATHAEVGLVANCATQATVGRIDGDPIVSFDPRGTAPTLGNVPEGDHGLFARLSNGRCEVVAVGCAPVSVESGGTGTLTVTVMQGSGSICGADEMCVMGRCAGSADAGAPDVIIAPDAADAGCGVCETTNPCEVAACEGNRCVVQGLDDVTCPGGRCHDGECCTGCWDGSQCLGGDESAACGTGGGTCDTCTCPSPTCDEGVCAAQPAFLDVDISTRHGCYILDTGALYCAGFNRYGQIGSGPFGDGVFSPELRRVGTDNDWTHISTGGAHTCGLRGVGELYCWGANWAGQVGVPGANIDGTATPLSVDSERYSRLETAPVAAHQFAQRSDGVWVAWGRNVNNVLNVGADNENNVTIPTPVVNIGGDPWVDISTGSRSGSTHACGLTRSGRFYCWGSNLAGQLGLPTATETSPPRLMDDRTFTRIHVGGGFSCGVTGQRLHCVGANDRGQLGRGMTSAPQTSLEPVTALGDVTDTLSGAFTQCAVAPDMTIRCWGGGILARGYGPSGDLSSPLAAPHLMGSPTIEVSHNGGYAFIDGENRVWGTNNLEETGGVGDGRLGVNDPPADVPTPVLLCVDE